MTGPVPRWLGELHGLLQICKEPAQSRPGELSALRPRGAPPGGSRAHCTGARPARGKAPSVSWLVGVGDAAGEPPWGLEGHRAPRAC